MRIVASFAAPAISALGAAAAPAAGFIARIVGALDGRTRGQLFDGSTSTTTCSTVTVSVVLTFVGGRGQGQRRWDSLIVLVPRSDNDFDFDFDLLPSVLGAMLVSFSPKTNPSSDRGTEYFAPFS